MTGRESLMDALHATIEGLTWIEEALSALQEIAHEHLPEDASPQLVYIVKTARDAVETAQLPSSQGRSRKARRIGATQ